MARSLVKPPLFRLYRRGNFARKGCVMTDNKDWWRGAVIYQIYPRSYSDSNADGIGDLPGIISKLDYVASLGVDAIWISPFFKSPMKDFGYDISDYRDVDPIFGSLDDFRLLLKEAHARGLRRSAPEASDIHVLGPAEAALALVGGRHRFRLLVHGERRSDMQAFIRELLAAGPKPRGSVRVQVDIDPQSFL